MLIGENGSGKTTILDAAAVAPGVWLVDIPDAMLANSRRPLTASYKRIKRIIDGDRLQFFPVTDAMFVRATGNILDQTGIIWVPS